MTQALPPAGDPDRRYHDLVSRHFDGLLSAGESIELGGLIASAPVRARDFARRSMFHQHLRAVLRLDREYGPSSPQPPIGRWARWWGPRAAGIMLAVALGASTLLAGITAVRRSPVAESVASAGVEPYAVMTAACDAVWSDPNVALTLRHGGLPPGRITLVSGKAEFLFASGGTAVIEGPATFEPIAADALRVIRGDVRCRCPREGTELRVETPTSTIVDLGTEFAVSVEPERRTRIAVIEGKVRLDVADASHLVSAGRAMSIDAQGAASEDDSFLNDVPARAVLAPFAEEIFAAGENALLDPSFESTTPGEPFDESGDFVLGPWRGSGRHVARVSAPTSSGTSAVRLRSAGNRFWPLVTQDVATGDIQGRQVLAAVRVAQLADDPLVGRQRAILKIQFIDREGREFAYAERHFLRAGGAVGEFVEGRVAAVAPAGATAVRCQILLNAHGEPSGSLIVDDVIVVVSP